MYPVFFEGATEIKKPVDMTDEQCTSIWAKYGLETLLTIFQNKGAAPIPPGVLPDTDNEGFRYFITAWMPNKEDREAINRGEAIFIKTVSNGLPPMALFTLDENDKINMQLEAGQKRYCLFAWRHYEARGGMGDVIGWYSTVQEAAETRWEDDHTAEIYDMVTGRAALFFEGNEWRHPADPRNSKRIIYDEDQPTEGQENE